MNPEAGLSIIVPAFNEAGRIGRCLAALQAQTVMTPQTGHGRAEIIVVDDGSSDDTVAVASRYPVRLLSQPHLGSAAARNRGAEAAIGQFLLFTDADCRPLPDWAARMVAPFADQRVAAVKGLFASDQPSLVGRLVQAEYEEKEARMLRQAQVAFVDTAAAGFRADVFRAVGGFREDLPAVEDTELSFRLAEQGHRIVVAPKARVYHAHPETVADYARRKFRYGRWGARVYLAFPARVVDDTRTPWSMRCQLLLVPLLAVLTFLLGAALVRRSDAHWLGRLWLATLLSYAASVIPFAWRTRRDPAVALAAWPLFAVRGLAVASGVAFGLLSCPRRLRLARRSGSPPASGRSPGKWLPLAGQRLRSLARSRTGAPGAAEPARTDRP